MRRWLWVVGAVAGVVAIVAWILFPGEVHRSSESGERDTIAAARNWTFTSSPSSGGSDRIEGPDDLPWMGGLIRVVDETGAAVAGADVDVLGESTDLDSAGLTPKQYEDYLRMQLVLATGPTDFDPEPILVEIATGKTDARGELRTWIGIDVGTVVVARDGKGREGVAPMYTLHPNDVGLTGETPRRGRVPGETSVTVVVEPAREISGRLVDEDKNPAAGVALAVRRDGGDDVYAAVADQGVKTDEDGRFRIRLRAGGSYAVQVSDPAWHDDGPARIESGKSRSAEVEIIVHRSHRITGTCVGPEGRPAPAIVSARQARGERGRWPFVGYAKTDDAGRFEIGTLDRGAVRLDAHGDGDLAVEDVAAEAGATEIVLRLVPVERPLATPDEAD